MIYRPAYAAQGFWGRSDIPPKMRQHERGFAGGGKYKNKKEQCEHTGFITTLRQGCCTVAAL
jgi:hypothetical protein